MSGFESASAVRSLADASGTDATGPRRFEAAFPDGWQQGKGAFGGLVVGTLARAIVATEAELSLAGGASSGGPRTLRSLNADLLVAAPPGPTTIEVSTLRRGGNVSFLEGRLSQNGVLVARAGATLASPRSIDRSPVADVLPLPVVEPQPPWESVPILPVAPPLGPAFATHYEFRSSGPLPFSSGDRAFVTGWIRQRERGGLLDEAAIIGLLDAWWPTTLVVDSRPRATVTVAFTMQLVKSPSELDPELPLFYRAHGIGGGDNFFIEMRELWSGGEVVALNQQTFAILT